VIGFGLDCQSILKSGFGFGLTITYLRWIWIGFTIQINRIEQQPGNRFGGHKKVAHFFSFKLDIVKGRRSYSLPRNPPSC
jgi:hypothetical protein